MLFSNLFRYKSWADQELLAAVEPLDGEAHAADRHAALRILNHIHVVDRIFAAHLQKIAHVYSATNTPETPSLEALQAQFADSDRWYEGFVAELAPEALRENIAFAFTDGSLGRMSREEMLLHVITHGGYHRGAVGRILAQRSIAPPRDLFTGFLHQAEPARRERP